MFGLLVASALAVEIVPATLVVGCASRVEVRGASSGDTVYLYQSATAEVGTCPPRLGGACLDLDAPARLVGSARANRLGNAALTWTPRAEGTVLAQAYEAGRTPGLSAIYELAVLPRSLDADGDGLSNLEECTLGTDPSDPDTDGDGWSDGDEVDQLGSDPLDPDDGAWYGRGTWFWRDTGDPNGAGAVVGDAAAEAATLAAFGELGVRRVYGSFDWLNATAGEISSWNADVHAAGGTSFLLLSENTWIDPTNQADLEDLLQDRLLSFNAAHPGGRFDGVHLDIEPQGLDEWDTWDAAQKRQALDDLADTYTFVRATLDAGGATDVPIFADLPVWFDNLPADGGSVGWADAADRDAWFDALAASLDGVSLMAFERSTLSLIDSGVSWELANVPLEVRVGLEADVGCGATWETVADLLDMADQVEAAYGPLVGVDLQSWSATAAQLDPATTTDCVEPPVE